MIKEISLCGFNCGICPAYKYNLKTDEDRFLIDKGWKTFHKTPGWTYEQPFCNGCFDNPEIGPLWSSCPIRKCVLGNEIKNCGHCLDYPCPRINNMIHITGVIAERTKKHGTEEDFQNFALPHLNKAYLDETHRNFAKTLQKTEYHPLKIKTRSFPSQLKPEAPRIIQLDPNEFEKALKSLHSIIENIMTLKCRTPGGQEQEIKNNKEVAKFLWIIGKYGKYQTKNEDYLIEITKTDIKNHLGYGKHRIKKKIRELQEYDIDGTFFKEKIHIKFSNNPKITIVLQNYIKSLLENFKERTAYTRFWKADMNLYSV